MEISEKKSVLFIVPKANGHLIKTVKIAKNYLNNGYKVHYAVQGKAIDFFNEIPCPHTYLQSSFFGYNYKKLNKINKIKKWYLEWKDRKFENRFYPRKKEIENVLQIHKPSHIFIDVFCMSDFLFCYEYATTYNCQIIGISPFFPEIKDSIVPPLNIFDFPGKNSIKHWYNKNKKDRKKNTKQKWMFPFRSDKQLISKAMRKLNIPTKHTPIYWNKFPIFQDIDFWYLQPKELDFQEQLLPNKHKYKGPMIDMGIKEKQDTRLDFILKLKNKTPNSKLIFCSLGTVVLQQVNPEIVIDFFNKIIQIGKENPDFFIVINASKSIKNKLKIQSINVIIFDRVPFLKVLENADLFITHGGGNSYLEAIYSKTPMLVIPPSNKWDYNGNAARIVNKKIGEKVEFNSPILKLHESINRMLSNEKMKNEIKKVKQESIDSYLNDSFKL